MSSNVNNVISSSRDFKIGENTYKMKAMSLACFGIFCDWCDMQKVQKAIEIMELCGKEIDTDYLTSLEGDQNYYDKQMATAKGLTHLVYLMIRENNENVDEAYIKKNLGIKDLDNFANIALKDLKENSIKGKKGKSKNVKARSQLKN